VALRSAAIPGPVSWSAATLAEKAGISHPTVQRAESTDDVPRMKTTNLSRSSASWRKLGWVSSIQVSTGMAASGSS